MAELIPFRGVVYNPSKVSNLADVIAPPFDVITKSEQNSFYERSPYNIVRLILGKHTRFDTRTNNPHARAAQYLQAWLSEKILIRDSQPALYLTTLKFRFDDRTIIRHGIIGLVRLEPFEKRIVLPHERTFSKVKSERLGLMKACQTNFSPIFSIYNDTDGVLEGLKTAVSNTPPDHHFTDFGGYTHRLWRITDPSVIDSTCRKMRPKTLLIADGHHRYETALNYRNWYRDQHADVSGNHPVNHVMMYMTSMQDPGLMILPAHRMLKEVPKSDLANLVPSAAEFFDIETFSFDENERDLALTNFLKNLKAKSSTPCVGVFIRNRREFILLSLKPGLQQTVFKSLLPEPLRNLDVSILTQLIFTELLGFDHNRLDDETLIGYSVRAQETVDAVCSGEFDAAFLLNPVNIEQVLAVAEAQHVMPRKATYFYPKVTTGLVVNLLMR